MKYNIFTIMHNETKLLHLQISFIKKKKVRRKKSSWFIFLKFLCFANPLIWDHCINRKKITDSWTGRSIEKRMIYDPRRLYPFSHRKLKLAIVFMVRRFQGSICTPCHKTSCTYIYIYLFFSFLFSYLIDRVVEPLPLYIRLVF